MLDTTNIDQMRTCTELQIFDRKSARIDAKALAITIIAFANADGGDIAIGLEDDGTVTGIDGAQQHINELLRAPYDFCVPSVQVKNTFVECVDCKGKPNHVLVMQVPPSSQLHANQADEAYMRVGGYLVVWQEPTAIFSACESSVYPLRGCRRTLWRANECHQGCYL